MKLSFAAIAVTAASASHLGYEPLGTFIPPNCRDLLIPVTVAPQLYNLTKYVPTNQTSLISFVTETVALNSNVTLGELTQSPSITFNMSARLCMPTTHEPRNNTIQMLIHGIGFDKGYWDILYKPEVYSYQRVLNAAGYATFAIDRVGVGLSSPGIDGANIKQTATHIEAVNVLTTMLRDGTIGKYQNVVHVGHSYGSIISNGLVAKYPEQSQGLVLTGYANNGTWVPQTYAAWNLDIASRNKPDRFGPGSNSPLPNSYVSFGNLAANQLAFFKAPFEENLLLYSEARKQPVSIGELLTIGGGIVPAPQFTKPVIVVTGNADFIFCGGDCNAKPNIGADSIPAAVKNLFPAVNDFQAYVPVGVGHGINAHPAAPEVFKTIVDWMKARGY